MLAISGRDTLSTLSGVMLIGDAAWVIFISVINVLVQNLAPDWVRARVLAIFILVYQGSYAFGTVVWGAFAQRASVRTALVYAGIGNYREYSDRTSRENPVLSAVSLALLLALLLLFEGIFDIALFFRLRAIEDSSWVLLDGVITLMLGLMIYVQWPATAAWAIGVLVGVSLVTSGLTRVMLSVAVRKSVSPGFGRTKQDDSSAKAYWSVHK